MTVVRAVTYRLHLRGGGQTNIEGSRRGLKGGLTRGAFQQRLEGGLEKGLEGGLEKGLQGNLKKGGTLKFKHCILRMALSYAQYGQLFFYELRGKCSK